MFSDWRGPVFEQFDGTAWQRQPVSGPLPAIEVWAELPRIHPEPHQQVWLFALDAPLAPLPGSQVSANPVCGIWRSDSPAPALNRIRPISAFPIQRKRTKSRRRNLCPAPHRQSRARALAAEWRLAGLDDGMIAKRALELFSGNGFSHPSSPRFWVGTGSTISFFQPTRILRAPCVGLCVPDAGPRAFLPAWWVIIKVARPIRWMATGWSASPTPTLGPRSGARPWLDAHRPHGGCGAGPSGSRELRPRSRGDPLPALVQPNSAWLRDLRYRWKRSTTLGTSMSSVTIPPPAGTPLLAGPA